MYISSAFTQRIIGIYVMLYLLFILIRMSKHSYFDFCRKTYLKLKSCFYEQIPQCVQRAPYLYAMVIASYYDMVEV